jgi:hypothetical protein
VGGCWGRPAVKASSGGVAHVRIWLRNSVMRAWAAVRRPAVIGYDGWLA